MVENRGTFRIKIFLDSVYYKWKITTEKLCGLLFVSSFFFTVPTKALLKLGSL